MSELEFSKANLRNRINTPILIILALIALIGLLAAWDALTRYGAIIAAVYAAAAILSATAWLTLVMVRVVYGIRERHSQHGINQAKAKAGHIVIAAETSLTQARAMAEARILSADARKAEREADLLIVTAKRDEQVLISDGDSTRKFTAAHLATSGEINGKQIAATPEQVATWSAFHSRSQAATAAVIQEPIAPPAELPAIIPALVHRQRILIVGASDAGKTTLLRWLIDSRGKCLVIDPQGSPGKWRGATMLGEGLNYRRISVALNQLSAEMKRRHAQIGTGEVLAGQYDKLTIIIDDLRGIIMNCKDAGKTLAHLLTDGRSTGLNLIIGTHSRYVKPLGLEGEGDLRKGFVIVELYGGNGEQRGATLEFNADKNKIPHSLPGPHPDIEAAKLKAQAAEKIETDLESILADAPIPDESTKPTDDPERAEAIRSMYNEGMNRTKIAQSFGYKQNGGSISYEIKTALEGATKATTTTTT